MLANFFSWWLARVTELLPRSWSSTNVAPRDGIVIDVDGSNNLAAYSRRRGQLQPLTLGAAARLAAKRPVILRPRGGAVLVKHHTVPTLPRLQLDQLLRHELARITPFPASDLYWHWDRRPKRGDGSRTDVTLTMVPKMALGTAVAALDKAGVKADFIETGPADRPCLLPTRDRADRASGKLVVRGLAWTCASLAIIAVLLPVVLEFNRPAVAQRLNELATQFGGGDIAEQVRDLNRRVGIAPRLRDYGVTEAALPALADKAIQDGCHQLNPRPCTREDLLALYRAAL